MGSINILKVESLSPPKKKLVDFAIDSPKPGQYPDTFTLPVSGWIRGKNAGAARIEILYQGRPIKTIAVKERPSPLKAVYSLMSRSGSCDFHSLMSLIGLPPSCDLHVRAVFQDGSQQVLSLITLSHDARFISAPESLSPLMVTSLGRTGTTLLMSLLSAHPHVVVYRSHPYELRAAAYWLQMLKVLSDPANHMQTATDESFIFDYCHIGNNVLYDRRFMSEDSMEAWLGNDYIQSVAAFCKKAVEDYYLTLATAYEQTGCVYFAEKSQASHIQWIIRGLYRNGREIFLVRDFRDMLSSIISFNKKRGMEAFGRASFSTDEEYIQNLRNSLLVLLQAWKQRAEESHLVRYEDLVTSPERALRDLFSYLDLDYSPSLIRSIMDKGFESTGFSRAHQTSVSTAKSVGRWKRDLSPHLQQCCKEAFSDILTEFGYPL